MIDVSRVAVLYSFSSKALDRTLTCSNAEREAFILTGPPSQSPVKQVTDVLTAEDNVTQPFKIKL